MDLFLGFLYFIAEILNNVEFLKGFILGGICGFISMVSWREKRIKKLESDRERDMEYYIKQREADREYFVKEIKRLKKGSANLIMNSNTKKRKC
ncbi:hypothetical protein [Helicobacter rodentium]|uniref:hypothetical protein n=1 Tax=Helicobacter rodentium TaxID=59617 RepID=UPI0023563E0D|nr:hypothetical protein [Helicobacter rodentium]